MTQYARIQNDVVAELFTPPVGFTIDDCFAPGLTWVPVASGAQPGWTYAGGVFSAPAAVAGPTVAQQAATASTAGLTLTLNGSITLAATLFPTDVITQGKLGAVITTLGATGAFPGGGTSYPMKDATGTWHTFTAAQYAKIAEAIASYVAACDLIADGNPLSATTLPSASITLTV